MYSAEKQNELYQLSKQLLAANNGLDLAAQVAALHEVIAYHEWRYYVLNEPVLSDFEFDGLFSLLKKIERENPALLSPNSPTQRVSADLIENFNTVTHLSPMLSLENSYNSEDLREFDARVKKLLNLPTEQDLSYCVEPKFDGGTIVLYYENNLLQRAATRGDGAKGEEITPNAKAIKTLPLQANFAQHTLKKVELRGEVLMSKTEFERNNLQKQKSGEAVFANPRNAATGSIRMKDAKEVSRRNLDVFVYQIAYAEDENGVNDLARFGTHENSIQLLQNLGFKTPKLNTERKVCDNIQAVIDYCNHWEEIRDSYEYEIDGMVIKLNDIALQERCGYTSHHPRWAAAYKFKPKQASTKLLNIEFQVGRLGAITPVAKLAPVELAGVVISSVSLHNEDLIKQKDIRIGDTVLVERAGDVIPQIVKPITDLRTGAEQILVFTTHCPACQSELERAEKEAVWRCTNTLACPAQQLGKFIHFASKDAMNIDGMGESICERFYKLGWLNSLTDVYKLDFSSMQKLEGFGKRSADKLKIAIENSKQNPAYRLLYSLGIRFVGRSVSKTLVAAVPKLQDLAKLSAADLMKLEDIGEKVSAQVVAAFANPELIALLDELESLGVNTSRLDSELPKVIAADSNLPFAGKTVLFTGTLSKMTRDEAKIFAEEAGAKIASSVSSKLSYLVVGEDAGSKLTKAQQLNIPILSETEFLALIGK